MTASLPDLTPFLHAVADPMRRRILLALKEKGGCSLGKDRAGLCAADIEQRVNLAQPTISHHMRILEKAGLVEVTKQGHWRWYRRNEKLISEMTRGLKRNL
jgi:DNA-binding transcriptional ArsR family regulator